MTDDKIVVWIVFVVAVIGVFAGLLGGVQAGRNEACSSLQLEWVKDRCMKVTREEVK